MNKQEVIKILEKKRETALENSEYYRDKENEKYEKMNRARVDSYTLAIQLVEQIDEPQAEKVEVPGFVAEWYESHKDDLDFDLFATTAAINNFTSTENEYFEKWFNGRNTKPYETIIKMKLFGYTIKPKRYTVTKEDVYFRRIATITPDGHFSSNWGDLDHCVKFSDKKKAEALATLVEGSVEEV